MFSFFRSSKKSSPVESPENSDASPASVGNDFIIIGDRNPKPYSYPTPTGGGVYPSLGPSGANGPAASTSKSNMVRQDSETISYLQGVPFQLSPSIRRADEDPTEVWRIEVDQILANMTRAMDLVTDDN